MALEKIKGEDAKISISHKLYGDQKLQCIFNPIIDDRIGFNVKGHEIYLIKENLHSFCLEKGISFSDDLMKITIEI